MHNRRDFLAATWAAAGSALLPLSARGAPQSAAAPQGSRPGPPPIGCFGSVVFGKFRLNDDAMLDAVRAAGYQGLELYSPGGPRTAGVSPGAGEPPEALSAFKEKLAARGLTTTVGNLSLGRRGAPLQDAIAAARQSVTNAHTLGQKFVLTLGTEDENEYIQFCKVLSDAAAFGQDLGVQVVIKPHDGLNNTAGELLGWVRQVNHPNFRLFWDPGNIIYYTGKDPVKQLDIVAPYITGLVGKDCSVSVRQERMWGDPSFGRKQGGLSEVRMQFGEGKVDFVATFRKLKSVGFHGPIYVEGTLAGDTLEATIANARANREYLIKVMNQEKWRPYFFGSLGDTSAEELA
jgi:sugar phosphate isomerase/epimerase